MRAGLDPATFWRCTPGHVSLLMRAAQARLKDRTETVRAQAWMTALLMRAQELPDYQEWVTGERDRAKEVARFFKAWDRVAPALARNGRAQ